MSKQQLLSNYYITHRDELLTYVSSRLGNSSEAEDIVQNVPMSKEIEYILDFIKTSKRGIIK